VLREEPVGKIARACAISRNFSGAALKEKMKLRFLLIESSVFDVLAYLQKKIPRVQVIFMGVVQQCAQLSSH
jgi:hypothetical protein